jgi:hypothetical protein
MGDEAHADEIFISKTARLGTRGASTRVAGRGGTPTLVRCRGDLLLAGGSFCDAQLIEVFSETVYLVDRCRPCDDVRRSAVDSLQKERALAARARREHTVRYRRLHDRGRFVGLTRAHRG